MKYIIVIAILFFSFYSVAFGAKTIIQNYIAHLIIKNGTVDVQKFIDKDTSIVCYYSEIMINQIETVSVNCLNLPPKIVSPTIKLSGVI